jgi:hypothetical protein
MYQNRFVLCSAAALLALAVACSKSSPSPASPTSTQEASSDAAADGSTLKVPAPAPVSPVNGAQPDTLVLTANKVTGKFNSSLNPSYEFRIKTSGGTVISACNQVVPPGSGNTVSYTPTCTLDLDTAHTWSIRGTLNGANGPWSADTQFKSPLGGYINGSELYDPLYNLKTVGSIRGGVTFGPNGATLLGHDSHIRYQLPVTLQEGELSVMILGADEGSEGDKSKVFAMQEGPDEGDITDDDYRMTAELRGNKYPSPGSVTFRIITGDPINSVFDGDRAQLNFNSSRWYFWRFTWRTGFAELTVRQDGPNGNVIYRSSDGTGSHPYRPSPQLVYIGAPIGRAGPMDATLPGGTYKNLWVSSRPRPAFPGE